MKYEIVIIDDAGGTERLANATDDTEFFDTEAIGRLISYIQSGLPSDVQRVSLIRTTDANGFQSLPLGVSKEIREVAEKALAARGAFAVAISVDPRAFDNAAFDKIELADTEAETALLTAIAALEAQVPQWQPIETPPVADQDVLLFCADTGEQFVGYNDGEGGTGRYKYADHPALEPIYCVPTHWCTLPPSPTGR